MVKSLYLVSNDHASLFLSRDREAGTPRRTRPTGTNPVLVPGNQLVNAYHTHTVNGTLTSKLNNKNFSSSPF
eukprot:1149625-Pelagomonas_calceolata.AAC.3